VTLVFHEHFERITDATTAERQVKGWRRDKKEALIRGDYAALRELSAPTKSTASATCVLRRAQDEEEQVWHVQAQG